MGNDVIRDLIVSPLQRINNPKGDIYHAVKSGDSGFEQFGEAYFSTVNFGDVKGWKRHKLMILNLIVPVGAIRFVVYDDRIGCSTRGRFFEVELSPDNYCRLTVPAGVWMAFEGRGKGLNMLLNVASIKHDPEEAENRELGTIDFDWNA